MKRQLRLSRREFLGAATAGLAVGLESRDTGLAAPQNPSSPGAVDSDIAQLREVFLNPPDSARPMTRWWWFGGAVAPGEITHELELMRKAGLRGVELQPVYPLETDVPARGIHNVAYFSSEWFDLLRHTARETRRLGLQFDFTLGSGWPYGGPFIPAELGARRLRLLSQDTAGDREFTWNLAPHIVAEEKLVAVVAAPVLPSQQPDLGRTRVITDQVREIVSNNLRVGMGLECWHVPEGEWRVMVLIDSPTGMQVKRPTVGMEGLVLDHFSREALELFLRATGDRTLAELKALGFPAINSVFCDSLEVYGADWTTKFMEEFHRRRGYDLAPYLPALWEDAGPLTPHVRYDYHQTLSDLIIENFFRALAAWSEKNGLRARVQAHGAFGDVIEGYANAHIPEGENIFLGDRYQVNLRHRRLASSAAHLYSKPVASAETYTWLRVPLFLTTLEMMKAATDSTFLDGINQIVNHGYSYSPPEAGDPGRVFYASTLINHANLWWRHYPHLAKYVQRAAALLQQGVSVNSVAVYLPLADVFAEFGLGALRVDEELEKRLGKELFEELRRSGYDFDLINDRALDQRSQVDQGKLRVGTGEYTVVIVPGARFVPPGSLERLAEFATGGGTVIFIGRCPEAPPGLSQRVAREDKFRAVVEKFDCASERARGILLALGSGKTAFAASIAEGLSLLHSALEPDFRILAAGDGSEGALKIARENVGFLHRRRASSDFFFLSNLSNQSQNLLVQVKVSHRRAERWNLEDEGSAEPLIYSSTASGGRDLTSVQLRLAPFESCFVVFGEADGPPVVARSNFWGRLDIESNGAANLIRGRAEENARYWVETPSGRRYQFVVRGIPKPVLLDGPWSLRLGGASPVSLSNLRSWNELGEGKSFSGWGTYEIEFDFAGSDKDFEWVLDLGRVHETAEAELNGVALGAAWKGTRRLECGDALKVGKNRLIVRVANLWIHHMKSVPAADLSTLSETYGIRWGRYGELEATELPPSGLVGPVRLVPLKRWSLKI
ncbi:MAG: hypothetical protein HY508_09500 [Acidobacteria bacterium]|nr:hypothetical protein [Acidobacteriota bacterium]